MSEVLQMISGAMQADVAALRAISQNIANAEVPAYRRQVPVMAREAIGFEQLLTTATSGAAPAADRWDAVATDQTPGILKSTGEALHVAIEGDGYFTLQSSQGTLLTRRGDFHVSGDGVLTAASGDPVLGRNGPIVIGTATPSIASDGTVSIGGEVRDQLGVVTVPDSRQLHYLGDALYALPEGAGTPLDEPAVRQGFLEAGNVTPVQEMVRMMETLRHFESAQRFLLGYDQLQQRAISELGEMNQ
jgi:flagellar basal-body rod protein FlgF